MLTDWRQGIRSERQRILPQRGELIPLLCRVTQDPFNLPSIVFTAMTKFSRLEEIRVLSEAL